MRLSVALFLALIMCACSAAKIGKKQPHLRFLDEHIIVTGTKFKDTEIGGLSGLFYVESEQRYYALCDDRATYAQPRIYVFKIDISDGKLQVTPEKVIYLSDRGGRRFAENSIDPESLVVTKNAFYVSTEGIQVPKVKPQKVRIIRFDRSGKYLGELRVPDHIQHKKKRVYDKTTEKRVWVQEGVRRNLGFESLTMTGKPGKRWLITATESALKQDDTPSDFLKGSLTRVLYYRETGSGFVHRKTKTYKTAAVRPLTHEVENIRKFDNGLVDLIALDADNFLALERAYNKILNTWKNDIRLFTFTASFASDVREMKSLEKQYFIPSAKKLVLDFATVQDKFKDGHIDNIEGMTFGPKLPNGNRSMIFVSDNNFNGHQRTQFLLFEVLSLPKP